MPLEEEMWREETVSAEDFCKLFHQLPDEQKNNGRDFLQLVQTGSRDVVFVTEGYHKQQSVGLNIQLPTAHRAEFNDLAAPPQLAWQPAINMLHPAAQLSRELFGNRSKHKDQRSIKQQEADDAPFGVTERCKLLSVQYIVKHWQQQQPQEEDNPFMQHLAQPQEQNHSALSMKITLQLMSCKATATAEQLSPLDARHAILLQQDSGSQKSDQQLRSDSPDGGCKDTPCAGTCCGTSARQHHSWRQVEGRCEQGYTCTLEYPLCHLESSDYIVPADQFYQGMQQWSMIGNRDDFTMVWDGAPYNGWALKFRQRPGDDPFHASPWRSIEVDWPGETIDRENDPEDYCYGNPWEMIRPEQYVLVALPDTAAIHRHCKSARAAATAAAMYAPWTEAGAAALAAVEAAAAAKKRRKQRRPKSEEYLSEDFEAFTFFDDEMFYYNDDPEDYMLDDDSEPRRKRQRQPQQRARHTLGSRAGAATSVSFAKRSSAAGAAAVGADASEPQHTFGREMLGVPDGVCLVCRKSSGQLVTGHSGRSSQNCSRQYHVGCLLLLNSLGIRSIGQSKRQQQEEQEAPDTAAVAAVRSDGLLQQLRQQQQSGPQALSPTAAAAVEEASVAAVLHQQKQFDVCCPAHYCHGCGLNGKHEYMVWCCCCLVRVYHWRNCIPLGAEAVKIDDRDYIRCPPCVAAGVLLPGTAQAVPAASEAAAAAVGTEGTAAAPAEAEPDAAEPQQQAGRRGRRRRQQGQQLELQCSNQENEQPGNVDLQQQQDRSKQHEQRERSSPFGSSGAAAAAEDSLDVLAAVAEMVSAEAEHAVGPAAAPADAAGDGPKPADRAHEETAPRRIAADGQSAQASQVPEVAADPASAPDVGSRRQSPAPEVAQQLQELEEQYQKILLLQQQYQQHQQPEQAIQPANMEQDPSAAAAAASTPAAAGTEEVPSVPPAAVVGSERRVATRLRIKMKRNASSNAPATASTATAAGTGSGREAVIGASRIAAAAGSSSSSSALDALMPAWLHFSLEDKERYKPTYKLVAVADGSSSSSAATSAAVAAAALRHVAQAATRLPHQAAELPESLTELSLVSPQTHWLIGSAEKAESAKYKVTGSWTGCPVIQVPTPDDGVFGLCLVVDHYGLIGQPEQQQRKPQQGKGSSRGAGSSRRPRGAAAAADEAAAPDAPEISAKQPGVYLRCWKPVMQGTLQQQQRLLNLQQSGDERGGSAYQLLVNNEPFPEGLGRQELLLQPGDVITVQGCKFELSAT